MNLSLAILTGGKSKRFGMNKCAYKIEGKTMMEWVFESVASLFDEVLFVGNSSQTLNGRNISDIHSDKGPVGGLESALVHARNEYIFLTACDMPFISKPVVKRMIDKLDGQNVLCPFIDGKYQTTHAIYSKDVLNIVEMELKREKSTLTHVVLTSENVKFLKEEDFFDIEGYKKSFENINSPQELQNFVERISNLR